MVTKKYLAIALAFICWPGMTALVNHIEITESGIAYEGRNQTEQEGCKLFKPSEQEVADYFSQAASMKEGGQAGKKYFSPCITTGKVAFADDRSGSFTLQSSGFASVTFGDKEVTYFFRKNNPWVDPFQCSYAMGDEAEPGCE
ncbi:hypothetical protein [Kalamiella sp. sgz302252]|uniref:hypothetical protein n=1 Tax=Pantoea sp. sgz302252 TaxID=3341827 RepID=UPI0036D21A79